MLALVIRYVAFPKLRKGMTARYESIRKGFEDADAMRADAKGEVASYEQALAAVKAEAALKVEAARQRSRPSARTASRWSTPASPSAAQPLRPRPSPPARRRPVRSTPRSGRSPLVLVELATGKRPSDAAVTEAVDAVTAVGAAR